MKLQFAVVMSFASFLCKDALAADVYIRDGRGFTGEDHKLWPHNSCVAVPKNFKFSSLYVDSHSDLVRLWQGSGCTGENRAYGRRGVLAYDYIGDVMNRKAVSVSACHVEMERNCEAQLGVYTGATAAGTLLGFLTFGIATAATAAAMPAVFVAFYNGDCRFCLGYAAQCDHRTRNYKRSAIPGMSTDASQIADFKNVDPTIPRNKEAEKAVLPLYFAALAQHGHIDEFGLAEIFNSFLQPERLADCAVVKARDTYIQTMIHILDTSKDGKIDVAEFADLGKAMGAE